MLLQDSKKTMSVFTAVLYLVQIKAHGHIAHVHKEVYKKTLRCPKTNEYK